MTRIPFKNYMTESSNFLENCLTILLWPIVANWWVKHREMYFLTLYLICRFSCSRKIGASSAVWSQILHSKNRKCTYSLKLWEKHLQILDPAVNRKPYTWSSSIFSCLIWSRNLWRDLLRHTGSQLSCSFDQQLCRDFMCHLVKSESIVGLIPNCGLCLLFTGFFPGVVFLFYSRGYFSMAFFRGFIPRGIFSGGFLAPRKLTVCHWLSVGPH